MEYVRKHQVEFNDASIHAMLLLVVIMKFVGSKIANQFATVKMVLYGIQFHQVVINHQFPNAQIAMNVIKLQHVDQMFWVF